MWLAQLLAFPRRSRDRHRGAQGERNPWRGASRPVERATGTKSESAFTRVASLGRSGLALATPEPKGKLFPSMVLVAWTDRAFPSKPVSLPQKSWRILGVGSVRRGKGGRRKRAGAKNRTSLRRRELRQKMVESVKPVSDGECIPFCLEKRMVFRRFPSGAGEVLRLGGFHEAQDFGGEKKPFKTC